MSALRVRVLRAETLPEQWLRREVHDWWSRGMPLERITEMTRMPSSDSLVGREVEKMLSSERVDVQSLCAPDNEEEAEAEEVVPSWSVDRHPSE